MVQILKKLSIVFLLLTTSCLGQILQAPNGGTGLNNSGAIGNVLTSNGSGGWLSSAPTGSGTVNNCGTSGSFAYYASSGTAINCLGADLTFATHTITGGSSLILNLSAATSFTPPGGGGTLVLGTANQNWGTLGTGFVLNTTITGAQSVVAAVGTKCYPFQGSGGTGCDNPAGGITGSGTAGNPTAWTGSSTLGNSTGHNQSAPLLCADSSGSGTAQVCNTTPTYTPVAGDCIIYTTTTANTGTGLSINVNSLGAKSAAKWQGTTTLAANDVLAGKQIHTCYDGTNWELGTIGNAPSGGGSPNISLPTNTFQNSPCTSFPCNFPFQNQNVDYTLNGPTGGSFLIPTVVQAIPCQFGSGTNIRTCSFSGAPTTGDYLVVAAFANTQTSFCPGGDNSGSVTSLTFSDTVNTFHSFGGFNGSNYIAGFAYVTSMTGGHTGITVTVAGSTSVCMTIELIEVTNVSAVDQAAGAVFSGLPSVTTTSNNEIVIGIAQSAFQSTAQSPGTGWSIVIPSTSSGTNDLGTIAISQLVSVIGAYQPTISPGYGNDIPATISFVAATSGGGGSPPSWGPFRFSQLTLAAFPGLAGLSPATTATGDTQIDLHVGTPINANAITSAYPGNNTASTLTIVPTLTTTGEAFHCAIYVSCHTTVSTATVIPALLFTDEQGTAETLTGATATCTTAGTNDVSSQMYPIRAKSATTVYLKTTIANSPSYDVHAICEQVSIK